ncbi:Hypothetical predicted protein [Mytilus galloprovincialis]|uniref:Uncharacterized protein n=1 Tax=Mytilus galloprovincialis TaxID=29158 RepID=A0A8B6D8Q1_MYTGA|nr:Hypothetical predicted protein [Mytilus galloprovincialis]
MSDKPLNEIVNVESVSILMRLLRDFGRNTLPLLGRKVPFIQKQFVAATIVSFREINNQDFQVIVEPRNQVERLLARKDTDINMYENYSLYFNRIAVLLNLQEPNMHGEARLLDPMGNIKNDMGLISSEEYHYTNDIKFLERMKYQFYQSCGRNTEYIICVFSHHVPCTLKTHQCARLINEFSKRTNEFLIVSYEDVFYDTDEDVALNILSHYSRIFCLYPVYFCPPKKSDKNIETYLLPWDEEEEPVCRRISRRVMRAVSNKRFRTEKKKRKSFCRFSKFMDSNVCEEI